MFDNFPLESRTWIYQSNRILSAEEVKPMLVSIDNFCNRWTAHNNQLHAAGEIIYNRFIVLMVNENVNEASGCSIDKSVHLLKEIETEYSIQLFNRLEIAYLENKEIKTFQLNELNNFIEQKIISPSTIIFNNSISSKKDFETKWKIPLSESWLAKKILQPEK